MQHAPLCFSYKSTDFSLGFLPTTSPVQSLFDRSLCIILSYLFLSCLLFSSFAIQFLPEKRGEKERRNQVSKKGGNQRKGGNREWEKSLPVHHPEHFPLRGAQFQEQFKNGYLDHQRLELRKLLGDLNGSIKSSSCLAVLGCAEGWENKSPNGKLQRSWSSFA